MGLKSILVRAIAPLLASNVYKAHRHAGDRQRKLLKSLVRQSYHVHYLKDLKISRDDDAQTISQNFLLLTMRISAIILIEFVKGKKMFCGVAFRSTGQRPRVRLQEPNTSH